MKGSCFEEISQGSDSLLKPGRSIMFQHNASIHEDISLFKLFNDLGSCTIQTVMGYVCLDIMLAICLHFVQGAYTTPNAANGVGLAYTIVNVVIIPMGLGFNQSLNVHVAQAFGSGKVLLARRYLNLTFYSHILYFVPLCLIIYSLKMPFSLTIAEDADETADYAWEFLLPLMVSTIFALEFECFKSYMIACKVFTPFIVIHFITTSLLVLWCYLLIDIANLGITGAGIGIIITEVLNCILICLYLCFSKDKEHLKGFTFDFLVVKKFRLLKSYLKSSYPMIVHIYADFFVFFLLTFLAMGLGSVNLNAQIAFSNTSAVYYRMPISLSLALLTYGEEMGKLNIPTAKRYASAGVVLLSIFLSIVVILLWIFRKAWASLYSNGKQAVEDQMLETLPYFLLGFIIIDGFQGVLTGVLKGINRAQIVTYTTVFVYYIFGIPMVCAFTFSWGFDWGITGIWVAFGISNLMLLVLYIVLIITTNWDKQAAEINERITLQNKLQQSSIAQVEDAKD